MSKEEKLEEAFRAQQPVCASCGWGACFYELGPWCESDKTNEYWAACVSKDYEDSCSHRGVFLYLEDKEIKTIGGGE
jgi:hypothetical protein